MPALKLISLNVERSKHLDRIMPFLEKEQPDVLCVMELAEHDIQRFEAIVGKCHAFAPIMRHEPDTAASEPPLIGNAIFSAREGTTEVLYYRGNDTHARSSEVKRVMENINLIRFDCGQDANAMRFVATHFTWTPDGKPSEQQFTDLKALVAYLETCGEFVLCGDFNAPRGGEIFSLIAERYRDNIPLEYATSIDVQLHRAGHIAEQRMDTKMVDGLFTTPRYRASHVHLVDGVSDHMAIVAHIERN